MWVDEHNDSVDYQKLNPQESKKAHWERCYKLVSLLHLCGNHYVYARLRVVLGNSHEAQCSTAWWSVWSKPSAQR